MPQRTEDSVGPYSLQDFTLFHVMRRGYRPSQDRVPRLARLARREGGASGRRASPRSSRMAYDLATIRRWLVVFVERFFASQFKRSALPNGPKVSAGGTMSPARRLADAVGRQRRRLARRDRGGRPGEVTATTLASWASRKTSFSGLSRSVTSGSSGSGSPTSWAS